LQLFKKHKVQNFHPLGMQTFIQLVIYSYTLMKKNLTLMF